MSTVKHASRGETIEPVAALRIPSRLGCDSSSGAGMHTVVMFLMDLDIFAKFGTNVFCIVDLDTSDQFAWVDVAGYAVFGGGKYSARSCRCSPFELSTSQVAS